MARILFVIPTDEAIAGRTSAIAAVLSARPDTVNIVTIGRPHDYTRNSSIRCFLGAPEFTHLFFLDSDVEPPLDVIDKLLALNCPLATGCYPIMDEDSVAWALARIKTDRRYRLLQLLELDKPFEVDGGGAGCLLIRRDVFDKVKWPWFKWTEEENGYQEGEDFYFFRKCNEAGLAVMADPEIICEHRKTIGLLLMMRMKMQIAKLRIEIERLKNVDKV